MEPGQWGSLAAAQVRVAGGLVAAFDPPLLGAGLRALAGTPRVQDTSIAGVPATVFRPGRGGGPWPAVVVVPGVTRRGRAHPAFQGLGRALAATGHLAIAIEPSGVSVGELRPATLEAALAAAREVATSREVLGGRIALVGVSVGATLALLLAADAELADRISVVIALAPCCDIELALCVVTTGTYPRAGALVRFVPGSFGRLVIARSLVALLPGGTERDALQSHLRAIEDDASDPLAGIRTWSRASLAEPSAHAVVELLANDDSARFGELYAALPDAARDAVERISPVLAASRVRAPVEVVVGRDDKYLPLADAEAFAAACPGARLTVIDSLAHAVPRLSVRELRDLARLDAVLARLLATARQTT